MTPKGKRLVLIAAAGLILAAAIMLASAALRDNIVFFVTPAEITDEHRTSQRLRLGGLVAEGSIIIEGTTNQFDVTDEKKTLTVQYEGALPDLFREGQGIIAEGAFDGPIFIADTVLAKHDETYMPREIKDSLEAQGVWKGDQSDAK